MTNEDSIWARCRANPAFLELLERASAIRAKMGTDSSNMPSSVESNLNDALDHIYLQLRAIEEAERDTTIGGYLESNEATTEPPRPPEPSQSIEYKIEPGANLRSADLRDADLTDVKLSYAILRTANLSDADLTRADLTGADLTGADLRFANLSDANLERANLEHADLRGADLSGANLRGADLSGANLTRAIMPDGSMHN